MITRAAAGMMISQKLCVGVAVLVLVSKYDVEGVQVTPTSAHFFLREDVHVKS